MFRLILLALLVVPAAEIYVMIKVGGMIGAWPTVLLVVFAAIFGVLLIKSQGVATLQRVQATLGRGQTPVVAVLEGIILALGGLLLLIPGFLTDCIALLTLVPPLRRGFANHMIRHSKISGLGAANAGPEFTADTDNRPRTGEIIEGEVIRKENPHDQSRLRKDNRR